MSGTQQALRSRIKSVISTRKITKAMEMIANAKLFKMRNKMEANRTYAQQLQDTVNEIAYNNPDAESQYMIHTENTHAFTILYCSDLGLCGSYNQNVLRAAREQLDKNDPVVVIGTSLYRTFKEEGFNLVNEVPLSSDSLTHAGLKDYLNQGVARYVAGDVGRLQVLYTTFVNTLTFKPLIDLLLPCTLDPQQMEKMGKKETDGVHIETLFEPNPTAILDELIPMMIQNVAYADWMESCTSEQGSRRAAMKTATDNADDLKEELQLEYNKARQASITQEITEIVSGSNAV